MHQIRSIDECAHKQPHARKTASGDPLVPPSSRKSADVQLQVVSHFSILLLLSVHLDLHGHDKKGFHNRCLSRPRARIRRLLSCACMALSCKRGDRAECCTPHRHLLGLDAKARARAGGLGLVRQHELLVNAQQAKGHEGGGFAFQKCSLLWP